MSNIENGVLLMKYYIKELENGNYGLVKIESIFLLMFAILNEKVNAINGYIVSKKLDKIKIEKIISEELNKLTEVEQKVLRLRYGLENGYTHTYEEVGRELVKTSHYARQKEEDALRQLKQANSLSFVQEMIQSMKRKPISYCVKFKEVMISELYDFVFKKKRNQDTLLYHICNKQKIDIHITNFQFPSELTIDDINLSIRAYNCLRRGNIYQLQDLINLSDEDLIKIRNMNQKRVIEIREKMNAFISANDSVEKALQKTKDSTVKIEIDIVRNGETTKYKYSLDTMSLSYVPEYLFNDLFPQHEKSLYNENYSCFSTYVNEFLLFLGYVDLEQVFNDRQLLDGCLYGLGIVEEKHYITNKYVEYMDTHAIYHSISYDVYQKLQAEIKYLRTSEDLIERDIQDEIINNLLEEQLQKEIKSKVA